MNHYHICLIKGCRSLPPGDLSDFPFKPWDVGQRELTQVPETEHAILTFYQDKFS